MVTSKSKLQMIWKNVLKHFNLKQLFHFTPPASKGLNYTYSLVSL